MANEHNVIWVIAADDGAAPEFREESVAGAFKDALNRVVSLAHSAKFLMGQVLATDGKVLATVGPQGCTRIAAE